MSETEIKTQGQQSKLCRLAVASIALVIFTFVGMFILPEFSSTPILVRDCLYFLGLLLGLTSGVKSFVDIRRSNERLTGIGLAASGVVIAIFLIIFRILGILRAGPYGTEF